MRVLEAALSANSLPDIPECALTFMKEVVPVRLSIVLVMRCRAVRASYNGILTECFFEAEARELINPKVAIRSRENGSNNSSGHLTRER